MPWKWKEDISNQEGDVGGGMLNTCNENKYDQSLICRYEMSDMCWWIPKVLYLCEPTGFMVLVMKLNCLGWWLPLFTFIVTTGSRISFWMFLRFNSPSVGDTVHTVCWGPRLNKKVREKASGMLTFQTLFPSVKREDSHCAPCATVHHALLTVWWNKCSPRPPG